MEEKAPPNSNFKQNKIQNKKLEVDVCYNRCSNSILFIFYALTCIWGGDYTVNDHECSESKGTVNAFDHMSTSRRHLNSFQKTFNQHLFELDASFAPEVHMEIAKEWDLLFLFYLR